MLGSRKQKQLMGCAKRFGWLGLTGFQFVARRSRFLPLLEASLFVCVVVTVGAFRLCGHGNLGSLLIYYSSDNKI